MSVSTDISPVWRVLRPVSPDIFPQARLQLHHAVQIIAAMGKYLLPPRPDDSHTSLEWVWSPGVLAGQVLNAGGLRGALQPGEFALLLIDGNDNLLEKMSLDGQTLRQAFEWIKSHLPEHGIETSALQLKMHYEIPPHPVQSSQPFRHNPVAAFVELEKYWANAALLLSELCRDIPSAAPVRCWPHHFDIATLLPLAGDDTENESSRSIGVGLAPGDESYPMPYFYVTPWPYPDLSGITLPALPGNGRWHTGEWVGAVLPADRIDQNAGGEAQSGQCRQFLTGAIAAVRELIDPENR